jgi:hybrid cluster-associated redox disulfide protein
MLKKISKEMALGEVVRAFPDSVPIMLNYGLHCVGCHVAAFETIEQGAMAHGMQNKDIEKMLVEMNKAIKTDKAIKGKK